MRFICFALLALVASAANEYDYENQAAWRNVPGSVCGVCSRQSPVNILPASAQQTSTLKNLIFNNYDRNVRGTYFNTGHNVRFNTSTKDANFVNHKGTYVLQQFHFHWGEWQRDGSEHRIRGSQYDAEIHFVHRKQGAADCSTDVDTLAVVAVFGEASAAPITGIWSQLTVPTAYDSSFDVRGIRYSDLLPSDQDYYYYEGSLTTPPCSEVVQWFVLKQPIQIPATYISTLRTVQEDQQGTLVTHNVRDEQPLNGRIVMTPPLGPHGLTAGGVVYTRWGRTTCPSTPWTQLLYAGRAAGSAYTEKGGGANYICLPEQPQYSNYTAGVQTKSLLYGSEYETAGQPLSSVHDQNVPCAVCYASTRGTVLMIPALASCPSTWTREYYGYLMSAHNSHRRATYECMDQNPQSIPGSEANTNGALFYHVEVVCNSGIPCPPYDAGKEVTCVVCTK